MMAGKNALRGIVAVLAASAAAGVSPATTASGQARRPETPRSVRLYVLDGGTLQSDPARYRLTKEDVGTTELSVGAYLIVHPKGILMWETGAVPDTDWTPTGKPVPQRIVLPDKQERFVTLTTPLGAQLKAAGYSPADVTHLALSHEHWDHTANANAFANATWLVRQVERDAMFVPMPVGAVRPATYASLRNSKTVIVTADEHDVFGDGTVILKAAAGHTPGHQVLYLKMAKTGPVVLSGDLYHYPQERTLDRLPTFEFNEAQTRAARVAVEAFLKKTGAELWIQHNVATHAKLKKAPLYYE
jgi:glyoxylase-like metal-dependent hydrolase (beta-lactamase superfamily II)